MSRFCVCVSAREWDLSVYRIMVEVARGKITFTLIHSRQNCNFSSFSSSVDTLSTLEEIQGALILSLPSKPLSSACNWGSGLIRTTGNAIEGRFTRDLHHLFGPLMPLYDSLCNWNLLIISVTPYHRKPITNSNYSTRGQKIHLFLWFNFTFHVETIALSFRTSMLTVK